MRCVFIQQPADNRLILGIVLSRLVFEKVDACFAESDGHLDRFIFQRKFFRRRKKISNNLHPFHRLIRVCYFLFIDLFSLAPVPSANNSDTNPPTRNRHISTQSRNKMTPIFINTKTKNNTQGPFHEKKTGGHRGPPLRENDQKRFSGHGISQRS